MVLIEFLKKAGIVISGALEAYLVRTLTPVHYHKEDLLWEQVHVCRQLGFPVN